jgi:hypothetical protein
MLEEIRRAKKRTTKKIQNKSKRKKQTNKQSHLVHPIKEMNGEKIKAIQ